MNSVHRNHILLSISVYTIPILTTEISVFRRNADSAAQQGAALKLCYLDAGQRSGGIRIVPLFRRESETGESETERDGVRWAREKDRGRERERESLLRSLKNIYNKIHLQCKYLKLSQEFVHCAASDS